MSQALNTQQRADSGQKEKERVVCCLQGGCITVMCAPALLLLLGIETLLCSSSRAAHTHAALRAAEASERSLLSPVPICPPPAVEYSHYLAVNPRTKYSSQLTSHPASTIR